MIRSQVEEVHEEVYLLKDIEQSKMGYYSKEEILVLKIFALTKCSTVFKITKKSNNYDF
jgi:hypothetical protein